MKTTTCSFKNYLTWFNGEDEMENLAENFFSCYPVLNDEEFEDEEYLNAHIDDEAIISWNENAHGGYDTAILIGEDEILLETMDEPFK